jgi:hypothetical protein
MGSPPGAPPTTAASPPGAASGPGVGSTLTAHVGSATLRVTLVRVLNPAAGKGISPGPGTRFVGVELRIVNPGSSTVEVQPDLDTHVVDRAGALYNLGVDNGNLASCPGFANGTAALVPGDSAQGCVGFEVPARPGLQTVRYAAPGTPPAQAAQWTVG